VVEPQLKVLWFIGKMPAILADSVGRPYQRGGWLDSYLELIGSSRDVCLTVAFPDPFGIAPRTTVSGVEFVGLPMAEPRTAMGRVLRRWRHQVVRRETLHAARQLVSQVRPDLVHVHGAEYGYGLAVSTGDVPVLVSIQGSPTLIRRMYLRGVDRYFLRSLSAWQFARGVGAFHNHMMLGARASVEAEILGAVGHVAGRTDWDARLAAVMAPQAQYHHCDEPLRTPFYGPTWRQDEAVPGRVLALVGDYPWKGASTVLRAFGALVALVPEGGGSLRARASRPAPHQGRRACWARADDGCDRGRCPRVRVASVQRVRESGALGELIERAV
jgi:hypothetical protein